MASEDSGAALPQPEVISCYFDAGFTPALAAMQLHWPDDEPRRWHLPQGLTLQGPPPRRFGVRLQRPSPAGYFLCIAWDGLSLRWPCLTAAELADSVLSLMLAAIDCDLNYLLTQPVDPCLDGAAVAA